MPAVSRLEMDTPHRPPPFAGQSTTGALGDGTTTSKNTPVQVTGGTFSQVSAGYYVSCGVLTNGSAVCWGGSLADCHLSPAWACAVMHVSESIDLTVCAREQACMYPTAAFFACLRCRLERTHNPIDPSAGEGYKGRLGNGLGTGTSKVPVLVSGGYTFSQVSVGVMLSSGTCAVLTDGRAVCWGESPAALSLPAQCALFTLLVFLFVFTVRVSAKKLAIQTILGGRMRLWHQRLSSVHGCSCMCAAHALTRVFPPGGRAALMYGPGCRHRR